MHDRTVARSFCVGIRERWRIGEGFIKSLGPLPDSRADARNAKAPAILTDVAAPSAVLAVEGNCLLSVCRQSKKRGCPLVLGRTKL